MPNTNQGQQDIGTLLVQIAQITAELIVVLLQIIYSIILSIARLVVRKQPKSVRDEIVLITGAGHGIGKELAFLYAAEGATVVVWDINETTGTQTVKEIVERGYSQAHFFQCDVSKQDNVVSVAKQVQEKVGDVTILVNNAGIMPTRTLLDHKPDEIQKLVDINVMAQFWTLQAFLPSMKKNNYGHIVSLSSTAGLFGIPNIAPYCCTKFAVRGLMDALYQEFRRDKKNEIKFTTIYPYIVDTGLCKKPMIKYEKAMPIVEPRQAAKAIIEAQRLELKEITIPGHLFYLNNILRLLPERAQEYIMDFVSVELGADLR